MAKLDNEDFNARRFIGANGLQSIGDQVVAAKTVLPYLLHIAGAPGFFSAMLVPIRESGSMLPQAALTPWVVRQKSRTRIWVIGSIIQGIAAAGIGACVLFLKGSALGWAVVTLLGALALGRAFCSIASKDVQGRTISKGRRGRITGTAAMVGGVSVVAIGAALMLLGKTPPVSVLVGLIFFSAAAWLLAGAIFGTIREPIPEEQEQAPNNWLSDSRQLLNEDRKFRTFVIVRSLLLVSALSPTFLVMLSPNSLGAFLLATGIALIVGGRVAGVWADRSSKSVMQYGALAASVVILTLVASSLWLADVINVWVMPIGFFAIHLIHTAIRVGRKTYVVDMAEGELRTRYVAVANTAMGVILLLAGAISGGIAHWGPHAALLFLAAMGLIGALLGRNLEEVSTAK
ncbi:Major Facilitator Superfamily protein [Corynebacterium kalinowskii]|uniref:Major Facilitator Superfamily protein n=1 Tax=Corynebacterium kalinowskii TaxID=2675216 RepID=A0A6B8VRI8_9CORY|nr:Major Facilitator Superfamily protein [Corynebacterium kalinowskii]